MLPFVSSMRMPDFTATDAMVCALMTTSRAPRLTRLPILTLSLALPFALACAPKPVPTETPEEPAAAAPEAEASADAPVGGSIEAALAGAHRSEGNRARDGQRHPMETLTFFGLTPEMTVVELWPGGGWYTQVLAGTVYGSGKLITTNFDVNASTDPQDYRVRVGTAFAEMLKSSPIYEGVETVVVSDPNNLTLAPEGTVDMVLTFRNSHGWIEDGTATAIYTAAFTALRPGGVLGVVQHRAKADDDRDPKVIADSGYVREDYLIETIEAVGFKLEEKSEINANPNDTKDYEKGVWTLPPNYRLKDVDRGKYEAIGESDRMTLRFVKPAAG
jgi:predicted methyltransferase